MFWANNLKQSRRGSFFANETRGASDLGRGNLNGVGYTGFEVVGGCNWVTREGGGLVEAKYYEQATGLGFG